MENSLDLCTIYFTLYLKIFGPDIQYPAFILAGYPVKSVSDKPLFDTVVGLILT
jgi:hypothetical protein